MYLPLSNLNHLQQEVLQSLCAGNYGFSWLSGKLSQSSHTQFSPFIDLLLVSSTRCWLFKDELEKQKCSGVSVEGLFILSPDSESVSLSHDSFPVTWYNFEI